MVIRGKLVNNIRKSVFTFVKWSCSGRRHLVWGGLAFLIAILVAIHAKINCLRIWIVIFRFRSFSTLFVTGNNLFGDYKCYNHIGCCDDFMGVSFVVIIADTFGIAMFTGLMTSIIDHA